MHQAGHVFIKCQKMRHGNLPKPIKGLGEKEEGMVENGLYKAIERGYKAG